MNHGYQPISNVDTSKPPGGGSSIRRPIQETKQIELKVPEGSDLETFIKNFNELMSRSANCEITPSEPAYIPTSVLIEMLNERLTIGSSLYDGVRISKYVFEESDKFRLQLQNKHANFWHDIQNPRTGPATIFIVRE